jgi:uncharacterized protein YjbJ (UPF0337 family)
MAADTKTEEKPDELKGKAQEAWGSLTGDEDEKTKRKGNQVKGHAEQAAGQVKDALKGATRNDR